MKKYLLMASCLLAGALVVSSCGDDNDDNTPSSIGETAAVNRRSGADIWYNLQGMPVRHPSQGVYIRNGKKYVK